MQRRRPSLLVGGGMNYGNSSNTQNLQRELQTLRRKTQEALQTSRDEIARLEEDIEIKQMRISELEKETEEAEAEIAAAEEEERLEQERAADGGGSFAPIRRWSLAAGLAMRMYTATKQEEPEHGSNSSPPENQQPEQITQSGLSNMSRRPSIINLYQGQSGQDKEDEEADIMKRLFSVEQENKKVIEKHEADLEFKKEQVAALRATATSQEEMIDNLRAKIAKKKAAGSSSASDSRSSIHVELSNESQMADKLQEQSNRINELQSKIRALKKLQSMSEAEITSSVAEMNTKIEEAKAGVRSSRMELMANHELISRDFDRSRRQWSTTTLQLSLLDRVSQKCVRKLERKARQGNPTELVAILQRAIGALMEEEELRSQNSSRFPRLKQEVGEMEDLSDAVLDSCGEFVKGLSRVLKLRKLSVRYAKELRRSSHLLKETGKTVEEAIETMISKLDKVATEYDPDSDLLSDEILDDIDICNKLRVATKYVPNEEDDEFDEVDQERVDPPRQKRSESLSRSLPSQSSDLGQVKKRIEDLSDREFEATQRIAFLDDQIQSARTERNRFQQYRVQELRASCEKLKEKWSEKDEMMTRLIEALLVKREREDRLREFLEKATKD